MYNYVQKCVFTIGQLLGVITDTLTAFEHLKKENNVETCKTLTKAKALHNEIENVNSR